MLLWTCCTLGSSCRRCSRYQIAAVAACRHCCVPLPPVPLPLRPSPAGLLSLSPLSPARTSSTPYLPAPVQFARLIGTREHAEFMWRITKDEAQRSTITQVCTLARLLLQVVGGQRGCGGCVQFWFHSKVWQDSVNTLSCSGCHCCRRTFWSEAGPGWQWSVLLGSCAAGRCCWPWQPAADSFSTPRAATTHVIP